MDLADIDKAVSMEGNACKTLNGNCGIHLGERPRDYSIERGIELMKYLRSLHIWIVSGLLLFLPQIILAAEKGKGAVGKKGPIIWVADTRDLTGFWGWTTSIYNEDLYLYAVLTIIMMALWGVVLGFLMDFIMKGVGIELTKRDVKE
jgi:hypothetical protein